MAFHTFRLQFLLPIIFLLLAHDAGAAQPWNSPLRAAWSPDGQTLAVSDHTACQVVLLDRDGKITRRLSVKGNPTGLAWSADGSNLYVAQYGAAAVAVIDPAQGQVTRHLPAAKYPRGLALLDANRLLVADQAMHKVDVMNPADGKAAPSVHVLRQPFDISVVPGGQRVLVSNLLPDGNADDPSYSGAVSMIDLQNGNKRIDFRLPAGSSAVRYTAVSADGKTGFVVHIVGRTNLPTTQLERGWVNTNALSVLDLAGGKVIATVLLDHPMQGAADPWGLAIGDEGRALWVTISGTHRLLRIDLPGLMKLLNDEKTNRESLVNDLAALYRNNLISRIDLPGNGARGLAASPDGKQLAITLYYSGKVILADAKNGEIRKVVPLGPDRPVEKDLVRYGEQLFHDANYCFQNWLSCATCHPDGRVDGMNWDLLNDGLGNPKNAKSMVLSFKTPPAMITGVRADMQTAVAAGFRHIQFRQVDDSVIEAVSTYLRSLEPLPSPYLEPNGELSAAAKRGKAVFMDKKVGCATCHPAPLYTDLQLHNVGTRGPLDRVDGFDTPTLVEMWRSGPFLHDGSAKNLHDVLIKHNPDDRHGHTSHLNEQQLQDLIAFLRSL